MTDDPSQYPETGNVLLDMLAFAAVTAAAVGATLFLTHVWRERFREHDKEKAEAIER